MDNRRCLAAVLIAASQLAAAQADGVALAPGNRGVSLELPEAAFATEGAALSIDIDGYDVSAFSVVTGTRLDVQLEMPMSAGQHAVSVFLFLPDGGAEVLLEVSLDVPELAGGEWALNTTLQTNYRADEKPELQFADVNEATTNGSVSLEAAHTSGNWRLVSAVDAIYDRYNQAAPPGESWLLPSYELSANYAGERATGRVAAGNIKVSRNDLLFSKYQRRGAAVQAATTSGRFGVQMFSVASTPRNAFDGDYLAPGNADDRSKGVSASASIVEEHLEVSGGFVDGRSAFGGAGFNNQEDALIYGGSSWNVAVDSGWLDNSVALRLERAGSDFDADGIGVGLPEQSDDALHTSLHLSSQGALDAGPFAYWSADIAHKRVGYDFYSIGFLALPGNVDIRSAYLQGGFDSIAVDIDLAREKTNPDRDPALPTQTLHRAGVSVAYSPAVLDADNRLWQVIGAPSFSGWVYHYASDQPDADAALAGFDVDNSTAEFGVTAAFARETLSWSLQVNLVDYEDESDPVLDGNFVIYEPPSDSRNLQTSLQAAWSPGERVALEAFLQRNSLDEDDFGNEYRTTNYGLAGTFVLVPEELLLNLSLNQGQDRNRFGDPQFQAEHLRNRYASLQLNWTVSEAAGPRPGFALYARGNYARNEDLAFFADNEIWSIYVGATLSWAGSQP